jgi:hypothetical protein
MELTQEQLDQQDRVDGTVHRMLEELAETELPHDIEVTSEIRDIVIFWLKDRGYINEEDFYPSIQEEEEALV